MKESRQRAGGRSGRPRSEKVRLAILNAALTLLVEQGLLATTMEAIAARAGASTATLYRWWDSKESLALDAFDVGLRDRYVRAIDTGSLAGDLHGHLDARVLPFMSPSFVRVFAGMMAQAQENPVFGAAYRARVFEPVRESAREAFRRAVARGEIAAETDSDQALDLIYGAVTYRLVMGHAPVDVAFRRGIVDIVVHGLAHGEIDPTGRARNPSNGDRPPCGPISDA